MSLGDLQAIFVSVNSVRLEALCPLGGEASYTNMEFYCSFHGNHGEVDYIDENSNDSNSDEDTSGNEVDEGMDVPSENQDNNQGDPATDETEIPQEPIDTPEENNNDDSYFFDDDPPEDADDQVIDIPPYGDEPDPGEGNGEVPYL